MNSSTVQFEMFVARRAFLVAFLSGYIVSTVDSFGVIDWRKIFKGLSLRTRPVITAVINNEFYDNGEFSKFSEEVFRQGFHLKTIIYNGTTKGWLFSFTQCYLEISNFQ